jgi:putative transposon-encoded protein
MAVIKYKCDTCNREVDLRRNKYGLEVINHCTITDGCRGVLYQIGKNEDILRAKFPVRDAKFTDWEQRKVLYNHDQRISLSTWSIKHSLGVHPQIQVFFDVVIPGSTKLKSVEVSATQYKVVVIDDNNIVIEFSTPKTGRVQCLSTLSKDFGQTTIVPIEKIDLVSRMTNGQVLSIGTTSIDTHVNFALEFENASGSRDVMFYTVDDSPSIKSPWANFDAVYVTNKRYVVRSFDFTQPVHGIEKLAGISNGSTVRLLNWVTPGIYASHTIKFANPIVPTDQAFVYTGTQSLNITINGGTPQILNMEFSGGVTFEEFVEKLVKILDPQGIAVTIENDTILFKSATTAFGNSVVVSIPDNNNINIFNILGNFTGFGSAVVPLEAVPDNETIFLLSKEGFKIQDKILDNIVNAGHKNRVMTYDDRAIYGVIEYFSSIFPHVREI